MVKKIDSLLIRSFLPPFVVTFFIALFVFVMQTLWLYIDDIAGKGVGFFLLVELVGYMSVSMVPLALPVAVLISSVMVVGNLAERYELSSFKSAGVSLWRVMRPLMVVASAIGVLSFFCSNNFIPVSNLKFKSRLHDIKNQKPALSLEEGLFNDDFKGFSIRIGDKMPDNQTIKNVLLYDDSETNTGRMTLVAADSGVMYGSPDGNFFVMNLYRGSQVSEPKPSAKPGEKSLPMVRTSFEEWTKIFDLDQFELDRTDEQLFKSHHSMLTNAQLLVAIDSIDAQVAERVERFDQQTNRQFYFWDKAWQRQKQDDRTTETALKKEEMKRDSIIGKHAKPSTPAISIDTVVKQLSVKQPVKPKRQPSKPKQTERKKPTIPTQQTEPAEKPQLSPDKKLPYPQTITKSLHEYASFAELINKNDRKEAIGKAIAAARSIHEQSTSTIKSLAKTHETRVKHVYEFHTKFSLAAACLIFLFIGAPMGAIVRKGGFGWPLLISIIFFMVFIVIGIFSKNIAERAVIHAVLASWMACLVVFPMGLVLTYWAMRDMGWTQIVEVFKVEIPWKKTAA